MFRTPGNWVLLTDAKCGWLLLLSLLLGSIATNPSFQSPGGSSGRMEISEGPKHISSVLKMLGSMVRYLMDWLLIRRRKKLWSVSSTSAWRRVSFGWVVILVWGAWGWFWLCFLGWWCGDGRRGGDM